MKCKNKIVEVIGLQMLIDSHKVKPSLLHCIITNDEKGKTLSINNGYLQFSIPFEPIEEYLKGDYRKCKH